ncbi:hypothetical protein [Pseudonocardia humida]|uniref:Uncharacterized protein n=1 Tax=Pseudonocardia humida TaxID=2800819 RepID=A0ABT1A0E1_9PSEU|nr:hypothetical protein [Pseudonocardia humida]MCO1656354.1 hypothetical protein [Pseudonocardia humida]
MPYDVPGRADDLAPGLVKSWNDRIAAEFARLEPSFGSRFFSIDPVAVGSTARVPVTWFGDPAEPAFCLGAAAAQRLSDWDERGRAVLHNEYCEYAAVRAVDADGRRRLKRVQVTTELREYWVTLARSSPDAVRGLVTGITGTEPAWTDLYGVADPTALSEDARESAFAALVAGGQQGPPSGPLNTRNALFMSHPINGLDDLLFIIMFGARPLFTDRAGTLEPATKEQIFRESGSEHLACRHADPAAAMAAHGAAVSGRTVGFADPLGMYIQSFARDVFLLDGAPLPDGWVRFSRGDEGLHQRLEVGPPDDDPRFLDEAVTAEGATDEPVVGGHQIVRHVEVGPFVVVGPQTPLADGERTVLTTSDAPIVCREATVCQSIEQLQREFDAAHAGPLRRVGPRRTEPTG